MKSFLKKSKSLVLNSRFFFLAIMLVMAALLGDIPLSKPAHAAIGSITQYAMPTSGSNLAGLGVGPDNNIWYTANGPTINTRIGKLTVSGSFTDYPNRTAGSRYVRAITQGSDGNLWYSETPSSGSDRIVNMTTTGTVLGQYSLPGSGRVPLNMTPGPDGAVWFTETSGNKMGKITTSGVITEYSIGVGGVAVDLGGITAGPDGNIWFTAGRTGATTGNAIVKITTLGTITVYPISTYNAYPRDITVGSDGNLWFTEAGANKIGKITTSGSITEYSIPTAGGAQGIAAGSDGALWFTKAGSGKIGRVTTSGAFMEFSVPGATNSGIEDIVTGPDGAVWFMDWVHGKIGRVATELTSQTISFTSTAPSGAVIDGATYNPIASATSGLPVAVTVDSSSAAVCSIQSGVVSLQQAGTCTLNANQGGDADYNAAPQVQQSFNVAPIDADTSVGLNCPTSALIGTTITCTITITNSGPAAAENATLKALFSNSVSAASISGGGTLLGQHITWTVPSLASGASTSLTFSATASVVGKMRFNAALLQTSSDPNNSNNIVSSTIAIS